ncbi:3-phenylpropionate/cinnamic acid dioxygenase subunit alpha [Candidatus Entotheonellaceae bacterium PAL068K]
MATHGHDRSFDTLVDLQQGVISREIFVNADLYQQEQEQVFARSWLFVGHESQIPNPGDYFTSCMAEESVILARDNQDAIHVFLNTCTHRGMKVCRYDEGNTSVFTCPYHGWSFATDGKLVGLPYDKEAYQGKLDRSRWGLVEVPQLVNYKGTIWATWDESAPAFADYLGGMQTYLDVLLDCRDGREGGSEVLCGVQKWYMPCNWKVSAENFAGDGYHNISHRSVDLVGIGPSGRGRRDDERVATQSLNLAFPGRGHCALAYLQTEDIPYIPTYKNAPEIEAYFKHQYEERQRRLGHQARLLGRVGTVFPNMSFLSRQPRSIAVWHPRGAMQTEAWRFFLVDKDAPQAVKDMLRHYYMRYSGPGGLTEQDDMENWHYASAASQGTIARRYPYNYQMGLGFEAAHETLPGLASQGYSEQNQRIFYQQWAALMAGRSWDQLVAR